LLTDYTFNLRYETARSNHCRYHFHPFFLRYHQKPITQNIHSQGDTPMKNPGILMVLAVVATLLTVAGCSGDDNPMQPRVVDFSGTWSGSFTHPGYDGGSMTLTFTEVRGDSITGSYILRLSKVLSNGRTQVENYGGNVENGRRTGEAAVAFTLQHTQFTWDGAGSSPAEGRLTGTWQSRAPGGISGTFDISRN
jgi:hypothetical protein